MILRRNNWKQTQAQKKEKVASVQDIDTAITAGMNHPMGSLMLSDLIRDIIK